MDAEKTKTIVGMDCGDGKSAVFVLESVKREIKGTTDEIAGKIIAEFRTSLEELLTDEIYNALVDTMKSVENRISFDDINDLLIRKIEQALNQQVITRIIHETYKTMAEQLQMDLDMIKERVVKKLYADPSPKEVFVSIGRIDRLRYESAAESVSQTIETEELRSILSKVIFSGSCYATRYMFLDIYSSIVSLLLPYYVVPPYVVPPVFPRVAVHIPRGTVQQIVSHEDDFKQHLWENTEFRCSVHEMRKQLLSSTELKENIDDLMDALCDALS